MPWYRFRCDKCGATFEEQQTVAEHGNGWPECPRCHAEDAAERGRIERDAEANRS